MEIFETLVSLIQWTFTLAIIAGLIFLVARLKRIFNQERVMDQWSTLIDGANGDGEKVIAETILEIERVDAPNIHITRKEVRPGHGFISKRREFLVAEHRIFDTYDMYIGARDYGKQLFVSWYLVAEPMSFMRLFRRSPIGALLKLPFLIFGSMFSKAQGGTGELFSRLNLFDNEELTAYVTTVHHALLESVKEVVENRRLDFTKIDTKTRGFLNIS